jgi:hypothetical protein
VLALELAIGGFVEISEILKLAWEAVEIQTSAFNAAVLLLNPSPDQQKTSPKAQLQQDTPISETGDSSEKDFYNLIIERTQVDKDSLEKLVYLDGDEPRLLSGAIKGVMTNADSIRSIAHVLTVVRALGLGQQVTSLKMIRAECIRLHRNDETNFKRHLRKIQNFALTTKDNVEYLSPRPAAFDSFPGVVERLLGLT